MNRSGQQQVGEASGKRGSVKTVYASGSPRLFQNKTHRAGDVVDSVRRWIVGWRGDSVEGRDMPILGMCQVLSGQSPKRVST